MLEIIDQINEKSTFFEKGMITNKTNNNNSNETTKQGMIRYGRVQSPV